SPRASPSSSRRSPAWSGDSWDSLMPEAGDRTERATPRRREEARKHGQVALSPEVAPVAVLLAALALGSWGAPVALARGRTAVVATVAYRVLLRTGAEAIGASGMMPAELLGFTGAGLRRLFLTMAVALAVLGGLDYLWQRRRHEQSLKMSRHEVKEEHKETEG